MQKRKISTFIIIFLLAFAALPLNTSGYEMITLASGQNGPCDVAVDESYVYFLEYDGVTVKKVPSDGGSVVTLASGLVQPIRISIDSSDVYFIDGLYTGAGYIKKVDKSGGSVTTLASGLYSPAYISVDSNYVYFSDDGGSEPFNGFIGRIPKGGGTVSTLASGLNDPEGVAVDANYVYFAEHNSGYIKRVPIDGGAVQTLVSGLNGPKEVALDSDYVYFGEYGAGYVKRVLKSGGTPQILASGPVLRIIDIALDSTHLYYTEPGDGNVKLVPKDGGLVETIASGQNYPLGLATDSTSIYFAEYNAGNLKKIIIRSEPATTIAISAINIPYAPLLRIVNTLNNPFGGWCYQEAVDYMHSVWISDTLIQEDFGYIPVSLTINNDGDYVARNVKLDFTLFGTVWFANTFGWSFDPYDPARLTNGPAKKYAFSYVESLTVGDISARSSVSVDYNIQVKYASVATLWMPSAWCFVGLDDFKVSMKAYGANTNEALGTGPTEGIAAVAIDSWMIINQVVAKLTSALIILKYYPDLNVFPQTYTDLIGKLALKLVIDTDAGWIAQGVTKVLKLTVEAVDQLVASLKWPGSLLNLTARSPSGQEFIGGVSNSTSVLTVENPEPGEWTIDVYGESVPAEEEYSLSISTGENVTAKTWVPYDKPTIQEAINSAVSGDTIFVASRTYNESLFIHKSNILLVGANRNTTVIDGGGSESVILLSDAYNVTIEGFTIQNGTYGVRLLWSSNSNISENRITKTFSSGIFIDVGGDGHSISGNYIINNSGNGIWIDGGFVISISGNYVTNNSGNGILVDAGMFVDSISGNHITANSGSGILVDAGSVVDSISGNYVTNNGNGIVFRGGSLVSSIFENTIENNGCGISIEDPCPCKIYHNNFINNSVQLWFSFESLILDDGYPSGGNYWSNYPGEDLYFGPYQNVTGSDGIGDTPYAIDIRNIDNYPLMSPFEYWSNPILGDINKDMKVDNKDLSQLAAAYGSTLLTPSGNPNCDINGDGKVDIKDLFNLSKNYGKTYP